VKKPFIIAAVCCLVAAVHADEWHVDKEAGTNQVKFTSKVVGFTFGGETDRIDGYLYWEGDELFEKNDQLRFEVDLNSLDTGIGKRDRDMRKVLETDKWPKAIFEGEVSFHEPVDSTVTAYRVKVKGRMSLHGVEREMEVPGTMHFEEGGCRVLSRFALQLADFDIEAPSLAAFVKVSQEIAIAVSFSMKRAQ
jgi:polyisoprenoid-binding protein YceI